MIGSDFNRLNGGWIFGVAIVAGIVIVIALWEIAKALVPHIHLYWK